MSASFSLQRNLTALYMIKVAKWLNLVMPIVVLFYQSNGLTMQDIFTLQAVYSATLMLLEIPTGYFADIAGRKLSLLAGSFLGTAGFMVYSLSSGFWEFMVAETILGVGVSLVSGADSAMLYDSLAAAGKGNQYLKHEGRITSAGNFAEALAGIMGGLIAISSLRMPYYFQAGVAALAIPAALSLREPPRLGTSGVPGIRDLLRIIRLVVMVDRKLLWNTVFSAVTGVATLTMAWFAQPFFIQIEIPVAFYGVIWAVLNLSVGMAAVSAWKIEKRLKPPATVMLFAGGLLAGYFGLALVPAWPGLFILLLFYMLRGIATPVLRSYINVIASSDIRATVMSVRNFMIRGIFALIAPLIGWITDRMGLSRALLLTGALFSVMMGISLWFFLRHRTYTNER